ncbi:MAG TPA: aminoglycoside phosphotransferase family protein [Peptococcaceae bacterium]|nr:aminoglycoside phosphotransferase family protein [Peptococcaceae bacterium]
MLWQELLPQLEFYVNSQDFKEKLKIDDQVDLGFLAQGEYNLNYLLKTGRGLYVLRINTGSQMNLKNQIAYEYEALKLLSVSGVTPEPYLLDDSLDKVPYGLLVMEYLPGEPLNYDRDLTKAAETFARIHSLKFAPGETDFLIKGEGPFSTVYWEACRLLPQYFDFPQADPEVRTLLEKILHKAEEKKKEEKYLKLEPWYAVINTEVNSHNFIVNREKGSCHLIDWEKPIWGEPAQDLSMFLIITTTLWKSNKILSPSEEREFIARYRDEFIWRINTAGGNDQVNTAIPLDSLEERINSFKFFNYLRAISWCAMAWTEYSQEGRLIKNKDTWEKIKLYLEPNFIKHCFY